jgi:type II secretory pathway pseudopilin PulG
LFLEAAVIVLALLWAGTLAFLLRYVRQQREWAVQQAERDAVRDRRVVELAKRVDHFQQSAVRVGDEVHELRAILGPLPDKLAQIEQRDPSSLSSAQAAKLVGMGATVDELTQSCGLTQAEAQLMSKLHKS